MAGTLKIDDAAEYEAAIKELEHLASSEKGSIGYDLAITLADKIEAYETAQGWDLSEPTSTEREQFRREQMGAGAGVGVGAGKLVVA